MTSQMTDEQRVPLPENALSFISSDPPRHATISTVDADGAPHQVVIWYRFEPGADGEAPRFIVNSRQGRRWPANLERDRRASLAVAEGGDAVTVECVVEEIYEGEAAVGDISEMAHRYADPEDAASSIAVFQTQRRVSFVLRPKRVHVHGDPN